MELNGWRCILVVALAGCGMVEAADRFYGPGNQASGNWSANNWYTAATGGSLTTAPGANDRARVENGDQVSFDTTTTINQLLMSTAGGGQQVQLIFDGATRTLNVLSNIVLQTSFGSSGLLAMNGGSITSGYLRFQAAFGTTSGNGSFTLTTGSGRLHITNHVEATSGNNVSAGQGQFYVNATAGTIVVDGNVDTSTFTDDDPSVEWRFNDTATALPVMTIGGSANFSNSTFAVETETLGVGGIFNLITAGSWVQGFDSYTVRTPSGEVTPTLGQWITGNPNAYKLEFVGNTLRLSVYGDTVTDDRHFGPGNLAVGNWSADNWYTQQGGGYPALAPDADNRAVIIGGDQVTLDEHAVINRLLLGTGGAAQPSSLTFDGSSRTLTVNDRTTLQTTFGSSSTLSLNDGSLTTGSLLFQAGFGTTAGNGIVNVLVGAGTLNVVGNVSAESGSNVTTSEFDMNVGGGGEITIGGNLDTSGFSDSDPFVEWQLNDSATAIGTLDVTGSANFSRSRLLVEVETFAQGVGTYPLITVGTWSQGFDSYRIRTASGYTTVALGEYTTSGLYAYRLVLSGATLSLEVINAPTSSFRDYGPGNNAIGNWSANNWYTAQTGGLLTTPPDASSTPRITTGDQVTLDTSPTVDILALTTGGGSQQTRLTYDSAARTLNAATRVTLQNSFGASTLLDMKGGTLNCGTLRLQAGFGTTSGNGVTTLRTGLGTIQVATNMEVTSGTAADAGQSLFNIEVYGGTLSVAGSASTAGFSDPDPVVNWTFGSSNAIWGSMSVAGAVNFAQSTMVIDTTNYTGSAGTFPIIAAGTWSTGFDSYAIRIYTGSQTVTLGQSVFGLDYSYKLELSGATLNLVVSALPTPPAPTASAATGLGFTSFTANWSASAGATSYALDVSRNSAFTDLVVNNLDVGNVTSYAVTGLVVGQYFYRVRAVNSEGASANSNVITVNLPTAQGRNKSGGSPYFTPATVYVGDTVTFGVDTTATLSPSVQGRGRAVIRQSTTIDSGGSYGAWGAFDAEAYTEVLSPPFSAAGTWYWGVQMEYNSGGDNYGTNFWLVRNQTAYANLYYRGTNANLTLTVTALPNPSGPSATANGSTQIDLAWTPWNGKNVMVVRSADATFGTPAGGVAYVAGQTISGDTVVYVGGDASFSDTGLSGGLTYYYRFYTVNNAYYSSGADASATTAGASPDAPVAYAATSVGTTSFQANWSAPSGADTYRLDVSPSSDFSSFVSGFNNANVNNVNAYVVAGLSAGQTYYYRVRAVNDFGTSLNSGTISVTLPATATIQIEQIPALNSTQGTLSWTATPGAYYDVYFSDDEGATWQPAQLNVQAGAVTESITVTESAKRFFKVVLAGQAPAASTSPIWAVVKPTLAPGMTLMSPPVDLSSRAFHDELGSILAAALDDSAATVYVLESDGGWRVITLDGNTWMEEDQPSIFELAEGQGFFIENTGSAATPRFAGRVGNDGAATLTIHPGPNSTSGRWNLIGLSQGKTLNFAQAFANDKFVTGTPTANWNPNFADVIAIDLGGGVFKRIFRAGDGTWRDTSTLSVYNGTLTPGSAAYYFRYGSAPLGIKF